MPPLSNTRHELFAQGIAKGMTGESAYEAAGYAKHAPSASRLLTHANVQARVTELQERAAAKTELTVASVTNTLLRIAEKAEELKDSAGLSVARASMMDAAKLNGLVVDRAENVNLNHDISGDLPTDDEWEAEHGTAH